MVMKLKSLCRMLREVEKRVSDPTRLPATIGPALGPTIDLVWKMCYSHQLGDCRVQEPFAMRILLQPSGRDNAAMTIH
jgi:uncharacterized membrane protein YfbV (UPF0208 family)